MVDAMTKYPSSGEPNETGFNLAFNTSRAFYLELEATPERARRFGSAMRWMSQGGRFSNSHLIRGFDWATFDRVGSVMVDVGGGHGAVSLALAKVTQHIKFVVQDLPVTTAQGEKLLPPDLRDRVSFTAHDFFAAQPVQGADVYFFRYILHNWSDAYARRILKAVVPALKDGSRIVCYEFLPEDTATTLWAEKQPR
jgi:ubiquinone/menaquinone biosynthesis C-methylase UbiE